MHTLDLKSGNRTTDLEVISIADRDGRIVITKNDDFVQSFLLRKSPRRLMLIALGNIGNAELERLIAKAWPAIVDVLETAHFIEISKKSLIVHE